MEKFEIGQVVKIVNKEVAHTWCISSIFGEVFEVKKLYQMDGKELTKHEHWWVPPAACELLKDVEQKESTTKIETAANLLRDVCFNASYNAGWWHEDGQDLRQNKFVAPTKLLLAVGEIVEAMEGDRCDLMDEKLPHRKAVEVELADSVIRIMDFCGAYNLDIGGAIAEKMAFNKVRPDHKLEERKKSNGKKY